MTRQEAENILYDMWENGEIPSNFTEDHSEYETAVKFVMANGYIDADDIWYSNL
jgi:hypothetical protein